MRVRTLLKIFSCFSCCHFSRTPVETSRFDSNNGLSGKGISTEPLEKRGGSSSGGSVSSQVSLEASTSSGSSNNTTNNLKDGNLSNNNSQVDVVEIKGNNNKQKTQLVNYPKEIPNDKKNKEVIKKDFTTIFEDIFGKDKKITISVKSYEKAREKRFGDSNLLCVMNYEVGAKNFLSYLDQDQYISYQEDILRVLYYWTLAAKDLNKLRIEYGMAIKDIKLPNDFEKPFKQMLVSALMKAQEQPVKLLASDKTIKNENTRTEDNVNNSQPKPK